MFFGSVSQETTAVFYQQVRAVEPEAQHIIIADQAGFHLPPGHPQLPEGIRVLPLPAYSPELKPDEHVGSMLKMATANRVFEKLPEMEAGKPIKTRQNRGHPHPGAHAVRQCPEVSAGFTAAGACPASEPWWEWFPKCA